MDTAAYGGRGFRGKGKWREANRRRQLQTAIRPGVMPNPPIRESAVWIAGEGGQSPVVPSGFYGCALVFVYT